MSGDSAVQLPDLHVRIWSNEWRAYWRPGGCGYTKSRVAAWVLPLAEAHQLTANCGPEKQIMFEPTREETWP